MEGGRPYLIAGRQRLDAHRQLKRETIRVIVFDDDDLQAKLRELDENLCRAELSDAEAAEAEHERKQVHESLYPETKQGASPGKREKGSRGGKVAKTSALPSYTAASAKATGRSERTVRRQARRGSELGSQTLGKVKHTSLDKKDELDALVEINGIVNAGPEVVTKLAERAAAGEKVSAKTELGKLKRSGRERAVAESRSLKG